MRTLDPLKSFNISRRVLSLDIEAVLDTGIAPFLMDVGIFFG